MRLAAGIGAHVVAIREAFAVAGQVRLAGAIAVADLASALQRARAAAYTPRMDERGLVWVAEIDGLDAISAEVAALWSAVVGAPLAGHAEVVRYRKGSWSEADTSDLARWFIELVDPQDSAANEDVGGTLWIDGSPRAASPGAVEVVGPGRSVEVPLLETHRDRIRISGTLR
jgi:hypothetical protein